MALTSISDIFYGPNTNNLIIRTPWDASSGLYPTETTEGLVYITSSAGLVDVGGSPSVFEQFNEGDSIVFKDGSWERMSSGGGFDAALNYTVTGEWSFDLTTADFVVSDKIDLLSSPPLTKLLGIFDHSSSWPTSTAAVFSPDVLGQVKLDLQSYDNGDKQAHLTATQSARISLYNTNGITSAVLEADYIDSLTSVNTLPVIQGVQTDSSLNPVLTEGNTYILTDTSNLHANFTFLDSPPAINDNDIVRYNNTLAAFIVIFDTTSFLATKRARTFNLGDDLVYTFNNISWSSAINGGTISGEEFISTGVGTPSVDSATSLTLNAPDGTKVTGGAFGLTNMTTAERNALTPASGDMIYNITDGKLQGYQASIASPSVLEWINLDGTV